MNDDDVESVDNVVPFPNNNPRLDVADDLVTQDELIDGIVKMRRAWLNEITEVIFETVLTQIAALQLNHGDLRQYTREVVTVKEAIRAYLYRLRKLYHPLHDWVVEGVEVTELERGPVDIELGTTSYQYAISNSNGMIQDTIAMYNPDE